jgi:CelD/BcsL family acetyltransferase involved in cellulose biosynthesis
VWQAEQLLGVLPFTVSPMPYGGRRLRLLGAETSTGLEPLAQPGCERQVAELAVPALARCLPRADAILFEGVPADSPWPALITRHWPGGRLRLVRRLSTSPAPAVSLEAPSFEAWLAGRSAHFRGQVRWVRRQLAAAGAAVRLAGADDVASDLRDFMRLHHRRWEGRGGSAVLTPAVEQMVREAAPRLVAQGKLHLWSIEAGGSVVCSSVNLVTSSSTTMWLGGFDPAWTHARLMLAMFANIVEDAFARGLRRVNLGDGAQPYKRRLADGEEDLLAWTLVPLPGPRLPLVLAEVQARRARHEVGVRLGPERAERVHELVRRARGGSGGPII